VFDAYAESQAASPPGQFVRAIGRWSLIALVVNSTIGGGVFGLPSAVAAQTGRSSGEFCLSGETDITLSW
jgi:amino acid transporter